MKFIDVVKLKLFAGKGGDGTVAFHRELYVPKGGPSGGDGGKGGDIIFVGNEGMSTLMDLKYQKEIKGYEGEDGMTKNMHGKAGKTTFIHVPVGTLVFDSKTNEIICDIADHDQQYMIAKGGKGGKGNARFANSRNKAPTIFENGDLGEHKEIRCELKVLADVGLVGLPNAGKSTVLSVISKAKPQIADYPFTTLTPQLGLVKDKNNRSFVVADLPGLIKGASLGKGLGHDFLRHIERCRIIVHVLDMSGNYGTEDVYQNYLLIKNELKSYNYKLEQREEIIVANKMDIENSSVNLNLFKTRLKDESVNIIEISGLLKTNIDQLLLKIADKLDTISPCALWQIDTEVEFDENEDVKLYKHEEEIKDIQITNKGNGVWEVKGEDVFNIYHKTPISTYDNLLLFNDKLKKAGVFDLLREKGVKSGDIIRVFEIELEWKE